MKPKGRLIIIGGKEDKNGTDPEMQGDNKDFRPKEILELIVAQKDHRIEVITSATSEPASTRDTYRKSFEELGFTNFGFLDLNADEGDDPECLDRIKNAKTIFFSGGDQCKICEILKSTKIADLIYNKYKDEEDFTVAGTSAGAMCLSSVMIDSAENGEAMLGNDIELVEGLGFLNCVIDTHFVHRGRFGRLAHAVIIHPELLGLGLGEDTALIIEEGHLATCKGSGMAVVISARALKRTNVNDVENGAPVFAENITVDILIDGCKYDLSSEQLIIN